MHTIKTALISQGPDWYLTVSVSNPDFHRRFDNVSLATNIFEAMINLLVKKNEGLESILKRFPDQPLDFKMLDLAFGKYQVEPLKNIGESRTGDFLELSLVIRNCFSISLPSPTIIPFPSNQRVA